MEYGPIIDTIVWYSAYDVGKSFSCLRQELLTFVRDFFTCRSLQVQLWFKLYTPQFLLIAGGYL